MSKRGAVRVEGGDMRMRMRMRTGIGEPSVVTILDPPGGKIR